ncbi:RAMP superfamily CRISPR-associated protein [Nocardiopsis alkaliphila]|uniref:RAMP superfamily CRISPR-associated protein n=1 Tax=Nocardiopsis alkaliphila TaxID=225762 RepID=UPI0003464470|nr:RAMP superfamily CRISPR-associated protein [Nocardiopsis alkaliphila]
MNHTLDGPQRCALIWEFAVRLRLLTDTHVGAARATPRHAAEGDVDLSLDRDPRSGLPRLRATTLAGLLRHELTGRTDHADAAVLFGTGSGRAAFGEGDPLPVASALDLDDAHAELPEDTNVTVRVGTRVDPATGTVHPGRMWRWEVLPAGTAFVCHLRLWVPERAVEERLLTLLLLAVRGLEGEGPGIRIGGRTGRGHGAVRATHWAARRHDLTDLDGWFGFHARTWAERRRRATEALTDASSVKGLPELLEIRLREHGRAATAAHVRARADTPDPRHRAELRMELHVAERAGPLSQGPDPAARGLRPGLLMIGDVPEPDRLAEVDRAHRRRPVACEPEGDRVRVRPVLGDTALFALFKRVSGRLVRDAAEHLGGPPERWRDWHGHWWGADANGRRSSTPSRIRLRATPALTGGSALTTTRSTVDALFGDAVDGRLFTTDLHCGGSAEVVLDVTEPDDAVRGLLALLVRELATVPLDTLGAGAGGGNGRLTATRAVLVTLGGAEEGSGRVVDLMTVLQTPEGEQARLVRGWLRTLHGRLTERRNR